MSTAKYIAKQLIPPVLLSGLKALSGNNKTDNRFAGNYSRWGEAMKQSEGYSEQSILEKVKNAVLLVKNGKAAYERDSVAFDKIDYSWQLLSGLLRIASMNNNQLNVLDFGGSLGTTYYQNRRFLASLDSLQWHVVEQSHFVDCGKEFFEDEHLKFCYSFNECLQNSKPDVLILSSVLQYLEDPDLLIGNAIASGIKHVIVDKTLFSQGSSELIKIQHVPETIYKASYPVRFFNYENLLGKFSGSFNLLAEFDCYLEQKLIVDKTEAGYKGFILQRKNT